MLMPVLNLGTLKFGKPHNFDIVVKNGGNNPVIINKISVGCTSCTKAKMSKSTIGASEEGMVHVEFTPGTMGQQRKSVTLSYEGGSFKIEFTANVES